MKKGIFIVLEGGEGSGKTTQAKLLARWFQKRGRVVFLTHEPGGHGMIGQSIRKLLREPKHKGKIDGLTELFLFNAARAQHVLHEIKPALKGGAVVISDRFHASTYAYQIVARGIASGKTFRTIDKIVTEGTKPRFSFWFDIPPEKGLTRKQKQGILTRFEKESLIFHRKVRSGFKKFYTELVPKTRWHRIDGQKSIKEIHKEIIKTLTKKRLL